MDALLLIMVGGAFPEAPDNMSTAKFMRACSFVNLREIGRVPPLSPRVHTREFRGPLPEENGAPWISS